MEEFVIQHPKYKSHVLQAQRKGSRVNMDNIFSDEEESEEEIQQIQKSPPKLVEEVDYESFEQQSGLLLVSRS